MSSQAIEKHGHGVKPSTSRPPRPLYVPRGEIFARIDAAHAEIVAPRVEAIRAKTAEFLTLLETLDGCGDRDPSAEFAAARQRLQEAEMWALRGVGA